MTFSPDDISHIDIFPPINIARVGNSSEYFIGPEVPGVEPTPEGGYKDIEYKIKKQAARFRVYAYDKNSKLLGELTSPDYTLTWNVHVANKKGAWFLYRGKYQRETWHLRNKTVQAWQDGNPPDDPKERREFTNTRSKLIIDPGEQVIEGADAPPVALEGKFCGSLSSPTLVKLGEIRTDSQGRLLVLPSDGDSFSIIDPAHQDLHTQFDNDNWVDKMCDGTVRVTVKANSQPNLDIPAKNKATIITAPPRFASGTHCPTTLYELIEDIYERSRRREAGSKYDVGDVVYYRDIYPLFKRIYLLSWTSKSALDGHGPSRMDNYFNNRELFEPGPDNDKTRANLFKTRIRDPVIDGDEENKKARDKQARSRYMPQLGGDDEDGLEPTNGVANSWASLTQLQWDRLKKWSEGNFTIGKSEIPYTSFDEIPLDEQPGALTRAALEWSVGASLNPGCEVYWSAQLEEMYNPKDKFRFADTVRPGDIVKGLSLPWQSDFNECDARWWPSIRPGEVVTENYFQNVKRDTPPEQIDQLASNLKERLAWSRGANTNSGMVRQWNKLGFVTRQPYGDSPDLPEILVERQRHPNI